jgi:hypothetical protein
MKHRKNILFTFDYELFLGKRSGSVDNCLIKPTNYLIDIFRKFQIKHAIFFVDTTYLFRLYEISESNTVAKNDWKKIKEQLQELLQSGHYVFPHIHPHWLDAVYLPEQNQWDLSDTRRYRFHNLTPQQRAEVFQKAFQILEKIITSDAPSYSIDSYRAGGFCIQPFDDFQPFFQHYGIKNDFSVIPHIKNLSTVQYYDFTNVPPKNIYRFENDVLVENEHGRFTEYSISVIHFSSFRKFLNRILLKYLWKTSNRSIGDGLSATSFLLHAKSEYYEMASIELLNAITLSSFLNHLQKNNYLHLISHPKMLSLHNIHSFEKFCKKIFSKYQVETDFRKMGHPHLVE